MNCESFVETREAISKILCDGVYCLRSIEALNWNIVRFSCLPRSGEREEKTPGAVEDIIECDGDGVVVFRE